MGGVVGNDAAKRAKKEEARKQALLEQERQAKEKAARELSQQQTEDFRHRQLVGSRSLVGTSESSYLGE